MNGPSLFFFFWFFPSLCCNEEEEDSSCLVQDEGETRSRSRQDHIVKALLSAPQQLKRFSRLSLQLDMDPSYIRHQLSVQSLHQIARNLLSFLYARASVRACGRRTKGRQTNNQQVRRNELETRGPSARNEP